MTKWARGRKAFGFCDRCGFRYPLNKLQYEYENSVQTSIRVCRTCYDIDHEQLRADEVRVDEAIALRDPRPDTALTASRAFFGWKPLTGMYIRTRLGAVKLT